MKNPEESSREQKVQDTLQEEPFLRRWSKRKLDAAAGKNKSKDIIEEQAEDAGHLDSNAADPKIEQPRVELTDADMPPLEELNENSDFSGFFSPKVSESLRRQALRKLFHFQQFNVTDGLNDYDEDYTTFTGLGDVVTHEMKRLLKSEGENLKAEQETAEPEENQKVVADSDAENSEEDNELAVRENQVELAKEELTDS